MKNMRSILAVALVLILSLALFTGCGAAADPVTQLASGGTLFLKVNPEIAVHYDADGNVTSVESRNADAEAILASYTGFEGKATRDVVAELVTVIGEAGYFVEEIEGERRQITIEIEPGSALPSNTFLDDVADQVRTAVNAHDWTAPINMNDVTIYDDTDYGPNNDGITDYRDTDYGPNNDGVTNYTDYGPAPTVPATEPAATEPAANTNTGSTGYRDTDYGPGNDGVTDYYDTDYGPNNDGVTDYTDYGNTATTPAANTGSSTSGGRTDYHNTDYGHTNYGDTHYGDTNYDDGRTDYDGTDYR